MKGRLKAAIQDINLPPRKAAAILASVNLPGSKQRQTPYGDKPSIVPPKAKPRRKGKGKDDKTVAASKPVLLLGR